MIREKLSQRHVGASESFRWRGSEVSRLEELTDAVVGFALTLLVVSLEVPRTFDDLLITMRGFAAFAMSFGLLIVIWHEHYKFFRRYGLHTVRIIVLNTILLFLIVFYVYPLKFLFTMAANYLFGFSSGVNLPGGLVVPMIREEQLSGLYVIFGIGWTAVWSVFGLMYGYALQQGESLELNELEVLDTRASLIENLAAVGIGLVSIAIAVAGATWEIVQLAGWVYLLMFPVTWIIRMVNGRHRRVIEKRLTAAAASADAAPQPAVSVQGGDEAKLEMGD